VRVLERVGHLHAEVADATQTGLVLGTVSYLAPEQVEGKPATPRTDVYALGVVLYELLCGRVPFTGDTQAATAMQHLHAAPLTPRQVRAGIPRPLEAVVLRAMAKSPDDRYASAADVAVALRSVDVEDDDAVPAVVRDATPPAGIPLVARPARRRWLAPTLLFALLAVVAVVVVVALTSGNKQKHGASATSSSNAAALKPVQVTAAHDFDPEGDLREDPAHAPSVIDGKANTLWSTDRYRTANFGRLKAGVGIYLVLNGSTRVHQLQVDSPTNGWSAEVHVASAPGLTFGAWGPAVATRAGIAPGTTTFDLGNRQAGAVLLWITGLAPGNDGMFGVQISEMRVAG
jgi:serine/threonine-protein kinase